RDDLQVQPFVPQHLFREPCGGRVRNRVMRVHEIELLAFGDFVLLDGEREGVRGRLLEQGILELRDLMERHALGKAAEAERAGVRDEMNVVAAARELETELGRDGARATGG